MNIEYNLAKYVIMIEFSLVGLIFIASFIVKFILFIKKRERTRLLFKIKVYLAKAIFEKRIDFSDFPKKWKKLDLIIPQLDILDQEYESNEYWSEVKNKFIENIALPLARKATMSRFWDFRFLAARIFSLNADREDENLILKLLNDGVPLVYLQAIIAALNFRSVLAVHQVLLRISKESWLTSTIYSQIFEYGPSETRVLVENELRVSHDINMRTTCYQVLMKYAPGRLDWNIKADTESRNIELRMAALKFITYADPIKAIPLLMQALEDSHWEVRLIAVHRLGILHAEEAIPVIVKCLKDKEWWVKISAAEALKQIGDKGKKALRSMGPELYEIQFDIEHILNTWW